MAGDLLEDSHFMSNPNVHAMAAATGVGTDCGRTGSPSATKNTRMQSSHHAPRDEPLGVELEAEREVDSTERSDKAHHAERDGYSRFTDDPPATFQTIAAGSKARPPVTRTLPRDYGFFGRRQ